MKYYIRFKLAFLLFSGLLFCIPATLKSQINGNQNEQITILYGGLAHIGNGKTVTNSAIGIQNGKITFVKTVSELASDTLNSKVIHVKGKQIYPGFIAINTILGLVEIESVRATRDYNDVGLINPNVRSLIAYNSESKIIPTVRANGVLTIQSVPRGGLISGTSSVFNLEGKSWEDAVVKADDGIYLNFPLMYRKQGWWGEPEPSEKTKENEKQMKELQKFFEDAKAYNSSLPSERNLRLEAMKGLFDGSKILYVNADFAKEITEAVEFAKKFGVKKTVIVGGRDSWMVSEYLKTNNIPVVINRVHELPEQSDDDIDGPYKLAAKLQKAGIIFALNYTGDMEAMGLRNLPFTAGTTVAYGLDKEEAVASITGNAAKILGLDKTLGTLQAGLEATLFVSAGDALDMRSNQVEIAFIKGLSIDLNNHQKELYNKFKNN